MRICPQCGGPITGEEAVVASKALTCERCSWTGMSEHAILVDDALTGTKGFQSQLEQLYVGMAQQVAPIIGKLLIETGLVYGPNGKDKAEDKRRVQFLARVLQGSTRGAVQGIASAIAQEMDHGRN
jgi:hypothetical protein